MAEATKEKTGAAETGSETKPVTASNQSTAAPVQNELTELLAEYERSTSSRAAAKRVTEVGAMPAASSEATTEIAPAAAAAPGASTDLETLTNWALGIESERLQAREDADAANVIASAKAAVSEFSSLPADYAENYIVSRYLMDPAFAAAWNGRHAGPDAAAIANRLVERAIEGLIKQAKAAPDRDATEDRDAVTAAVRGASKQAPVGKPPDYSRMSDNEFRARVERDFGYRPV